MSDDAQALAIEVERGERRLRALDRHLAELEQALMETRLALETVGGLDGPGQALVPVGAGLRIPAEVDGSKPVIVDVGGGYSVEMPAAKAQAKLQQRLENVEAAFRATNQDADQTAARLHNARLQLSAMADASDA